MAQYGEYILSYGLEAIYGTRFWNYEYLKYNLNGRISLQFSFYWGILSILLVKIAKPIIDKFIEKIQPNIRNIIEIVIFIFLVIDCIFTIWGIQTYQNRVLYNKEFITNSNNIILQTRQKIENEYFTNERIKKIFPNIRVRLESGEEVWLRQIKS